MLIQLLMADLLIESLDHPLRAVVTVIDRIADQVAVLVQQAVIHAPRINRKRADRQLRRGCFFKSLLQLMVQSEKIPVNVLPDADGII